MKILYGVPSEGMGHATRSQVVVSHLLARGHDVSIATSDRAFDFLEKSFPGRCFRIDGFHLQYEQGAVDKSRTFAQILASAPESLVTNVQQFWRLSRSELPEIVISDFESFAFYFAKIHRLPLLSIDNMQVVNRCSLGFDVPRAELESYRIAKAIIKAKVPFCQRYLVSTFFDAVIEKRRTELVPPILRQAILDAGSRPTATADHILVYQTATSQDDLITTLQSIPDRRFLVYGLRRDEQLGNVTLRSFSEAGFIRELQTARAVVTNGGFSLISEAVYLHRPICSFPLAQQFEQYVNGAQVEKLGYGRCFAAFSSDALKAFFYDLPAFESAVAGYQQDGNRKLFEAVDRFIDDAREGRLDDEG
jgi:uncharacterized protein (TIGR00661 family)